MSSSALMMSRDTMGLTTHFSGEQLDVLQTGLLYNMGNILTKISRIKRGTFSIDGVPYQLSLNDFGNGLRNHLHGGRQSYDRLNWKTSLLESGDGVVFSILDHHGNEV